MQDIRKPYTRSRSNRDIPSRVEQFESRSYEQDSNSYEHDRPVQIPVKRTRRDVNAMEMFPRRTHTYEDNGYDEQDERGLYDRNPVLRDPRTRYVHRNNSLGTLIFITTVLVLIVGVGLKTYVFDSATITVVPKYKDITKFSETISFSQKGVDPTSVPYVLESISRKKTKQLSLSESRKVEAKASGMITVYNNYDSEPQKLIKNTRFESSKGKIYRISQSISVPGKKGDIPGSVDVEVYADSNGAEYNIEKTDFTIPGFKGSPRFTGFYAKSKGAITGGSSGNVSLASLSDVNAAKDELALELSQEIKTELAKVKKEGYVGMYSAIQVEYDDNESAILKGGVNTYEVTATGYLMFADVSKLASAVARNLSGYVNQPVRLASPENIIFTKKESDSAKSEAPILLLVEGDPRVVWTSNSESIKEMVIGKKRDEFKAIMKNIDGIEGAEISFSPLWLRSFPDDTTKIHVLESLPKR
jgi:hypothetical protein